MFAINLYHIKCSPISSGVPLLAALSHKLDVNVQLKPLLQVERVPAQCLHLHHHL